MRKFWVPASIQIDGGIWVSAKNGDDACKKARSIYDRCTVLGCGFVLGSKSETAHFDKGISEHYPTEIIAATKKYILEGERRLGIRAGAKKG